MRTPLVVLVATFALLELSACKAPRSPREVAEGSVTGRWTAESVAAKEPLAKGHTAWRLELLQEKAGKLSGRGTRSQGTGSSNFTVDGVRGESEVTLKLHLGNEAVKYHGSIMDPKTIVGEMQLPTDTFPVSFTRD